MHLHTGYFFFFLLYSVISNGLMLQMRNLDYNCENRLRRENVKLHSDPRNGA